MNHDFDVAIIGAGASGVLVAVQLLRSSPGVRVALIDAGARAARGLAYGTPYGAHRLNVPAGRMSAFAEDPAHFERWLARRDPDASGATFAVRGLYGQYLGELLDETTRSQDRFTRVAGTAVGLSVVEAGWTIHLHNGSTLGARTVVLALGNLPPADPLPFAGPRPAEYLADPWAPGAAQGLSSDAPILLIGTGLTMIDLALALRSDGHRGVMHAVSRRGLLPQVHQSYDAVAIARPAGVRSPREVLGWLRREASAAMTNGGDWRAVVDAMRAETTAIWQSWSLEERRAFLRHLRPRWDVHRHRCAPEVGESVGSLLRAGALRVHRGRITAIEERNAQLAVTLQTATNGSETLAVSRIINCTGPATDYARVDLPLVVQMRRAGWLTPDPLGLGVESTADGQLRGRDGAPVAGLFTVGPLRRPRLWESTAIPEIRTQAAALATLLTKR